MGIKAVLKVIKYKIGYEVRHELIDGSDYGMEDYVMKSAYTPSGDYIGEPKWANRLCKVWGIKPEKANPSHCVCSIGFCEKEQKWYGWSHRAMCGFGIGSEVKIGDCAYVPKDVEDAMEDFNMFWADETAINVKSEIIGNKIYTHWDSVDKKGNINNEDMISGIYHDIEDIRFGKGAWTAETLEDAKQMAIDYAGGVS